MKRVIIGFLRSRGKRQVSVSPETGKGLDDREGSR